MVINVGKEMSFAPSPVIIICVYSYVGYSDPKGVVYDIAVANWLILMVLKVINVIKG